MAETEVMTCMEVWGGNEPMDRGVSMSGLDAWVYCKPYDSSEAGGDVYYVSSCATGRITRLLIADVSGHGSAVSELASQLRGMMRRNVNYLSQSRFVGEMNRQFTASSKLGTFATAVVTTFFGPTRDLSICNAGHPPPLVYRARTKEWSFLETTEPESQAATNIPLGIDDVMDYDQFDVRLQVGDLVVCYTDSLPEARLPSGELLGQEGLLEVAKTVDVTDPAGVIASLIKAVERHCEGEVCGDDVTILLFRPNGKRPRAPFHVRALAPIKLGVAWVRSLRGGPPVPWPEFNLANFGGSVFGPLSRFRRKKSGESA